MVKSTVPKEAAVRFTMLLAIRMQESSLSYWSSSTKVFCARRFPSSALLFRRTLLAEEKAVSVEEHQAESTTRMIRIRIIAIQVLSIRDASSQLSKNILMFGTFGKAPIKIKYATS